MTGLLTIAALSLFGSTAHADDGTLDECLAAYAYSTIYDSNGYEIEMFNGINVGEQCYTDDPWHGIPGIVIIVPTRQGFTEDGQPIDCPYSTAWYSAYCTDIDTSTQTSDN